MVFLLLFYFFYLSEAEGFHDTETDSGATFLGQLLRSLVRIWVTGEMNHWAMRVLCASWGTSSGRVPIGYRISSLVLFFLVLMWFHVGWVGGGSDGWGRNERRDSEPI